MPQGNPSLWMVILMLMTSLLLICTTLFYFCTKLSINTTYMVTKFSTNYLLKKSHKMMKW